MSRVPGWFWVVLLFALLFAPTALGDLLSQVAFGAQEAFSGLGL